MNKYWTTCPYLTTLYGACYEVLWACCERFWACYEMMWACFEMFWHVVSILQDATNMLRLCCKMWWACWCIVWAIWSETPFLDLNTSLVIFRTWLFRFSPFFYHYVALWLVEETISGTKVTGKFITLTEFEPPQWWETGRRSQYNAFEHSALRAGPILVAYLLLRRLAWHWTQLESPDKPAALRPVDTQNWRWSTAGGNTLSCSRNLYQGAWYSLGRLEETSISGRLSKNCSLCMRKGF